jgi:hypothetical protein
LRHVRTCKVSADTSRPRKVPPSPKPVRSGTLAQHVVRRHGEPMTTFEILSELGKLKGRQSKARGFERKGLVQLDRGLWGLGDRDIRIEPTARNALVESAVRKVMAGMDGLKEVYLATLPECNEAAVYNRWFLGSLLTSDAGFAIGKNGRIRSGNRPPRKARQEPGAEASHVGPGKGDVGNRDWWTPERERLLRALFDGGMPSEEIKAAIGRFSRWAKPEDRGAQTA